MSVPSKKPLVDALIKREEQYGRAASNLEALLERVQGDEALLDRFEEDLAKGRASLHLLREAVDVTRCLRRLVAAECVHVDDLHKAFGAPGDFGYETLIGDALARAYGVR